MNKWMNRDELWNIIPKREKDDFYEIIGNLKEDLEFFNLYIKRNKKSKFNFEISFSKGMNTKFLNYLYTKSYGYHLDELEKIYLEYLVATHFFATLYEQEDEVVYTDDTLKRIYHHFESIHEMNLEDYVGDFIGCSRGAMDVTSKILKLKKGEAF